MDNPLHLSPDELLSNYTLNEIDEIQKYLLEEIKKKEDELKSVVSAKYRDLVEASDRMRDIKITTQEMLSKILHINTSFNTFQKGVELSDLIPTKKTPAKDVTIGVLIKLLLNSVDQIWLSIDRNEFTVAVFLLQLSNYVKSDLKSNFTTSFSRFPMITNLFSSLDKFSNTIPKKVKELLSVPNLNQRNACDCVCSIMLMENLCVTEACQIFIVNRSSALQGCFSLDTCKSEKDAIKNVENSIHTIISTLRMLHFGFDANKSDEDDVLQKLKKILMKDITSLLNEDYLINRLENYLPTNLKDMKLKNTRCFDPFDPQVIQKEAYDWFIWSCGFVKVHAVPLLNSISSLRSLKCVHFDINRTEHNWLNEITKRDNLQLFNELYGPLIISRGKELLFDYWKTMSMAINEEIHKTVEVVNTKSAESELNMNRFLWAGLQTDLSDYYSEDKNILSGLRVKRIGLSENSAILCNNVNKHLSEAIEELSNITNDMELTYVLKLHQQTCCQELVVKVFENINEITNEDKVTKDTCALLARFLYALGNHCPSLQRSLLHAQDKGAKWLQIKNEIEKESSKVWKRWVDISLPDLLASFKNELSTCTDWSKILPKWETVENSSKSGTMKIPTTCSLPLHSFLHSLNLNVSRILPPRSMIEQITFRTLEELMMFYSTIECNQSCLIQLLFDVKYLILLLVPLENKIMVDLCDKCAHQLEVKIDPLELRIYTTRLAEHVSQHTMRTRALYGILSSNKMKGNILPSVDIQTHDPNVMNIIQTDSIPWFPLLPI